jgi:hypothetical protein
MMTRLQLSGAAPTWRVYRDATHLSRLVVPVVALAFIEQALKNRPSPLLAGPSPEYPEVTLQTHGGAPAPAVPAGAAP